MLSFSIYSGITMAKYGKTFKKILPLTLAFILAFESEAPLFAAINDFKASQQTLLEESSSELSAIDNVYMRAQSVNEFEQALIDRTKEIIKQINSSKEKANIASIKNTGQSKYGQMWPMYAKAAGVKSLSILEEGLKSYLAEYYASAKIMPYKDFKKQYDAVVEEKVKEFTASKDCPAKYKKDSSAITDYVNSTYPVKSLYQEYKTFAEKEIAWRKANAVKVDEKAYEVTRAYISAIGAPLLSGEAVSILLKTEFNAKPALTEAEKNEIYNYNVARLEKQKLDKISTGLLSGKSERKAADLTISATAESIIIAGLVAKDGDKRYSTAVKNIIYRAEENPAFNYILSSGAASLIAKKNYNALRELLSHYNEMELKGAAWYEYLSLGHYAENIKNSSGNYLGKASEKAQYSGEVGYYNAFTDIAELLAEENSPQAQKILADFAFNKDINSSIKPFAAGALIYAKNTKADKAAVLANMDFGDIPALQEYDLDLGLLRVYPSIKGKLNDNAVVSVAARKAKETKLKNYGYLTRTAASGDLLLAVWGGISLFKMGVKGVTFAKSSYTAIKAANIAEKGARIAYIKANYAKLVPYISAKRSLARFGLRLKTFFNKNFDPRNLIKLENDLRAKKLAVMKTSAETAKATALQSGKPADAAKAAFMQSQYSTMQAGSDLLGQARMVNMESLLGKYNAYRNGVSGLMPKQLFTPAETRFMGSAVNYASNAAELNRSFAAYFQHMSFAQRSRILLSNKFSSWWNGFKNTIAAYRQSAPKFTSYVDVTGQYPSFNTPALIPARVGNAFGQTSLASYPYAHSSMLVPVSASRVPRNKRIPSFLPEHMRQPFVPEQATFKIASVGVGGGLGSGYYIKKGTLDIPLVFTAAHVVGDANFVQVRDTDGFYTSGRVVNINKASGYDLAAVLLDEPSFLKGRVPFTMGLTAPANGTPLMAHSYPDGGFYRTSIIEMLDNNYFHPYNKFPSYEVTPSTIMPGSSGGAVSLGDFDGTLIGMVMSLLDKTGNVLLVPLPLIKQFYTETVKKILFNPVLHSAYLPKLPGLRAAYPNIISKYPYGKESYLTPPFEDRLSSAKIDRFLSFSHIKAESILKSSVFQVEKGLDYGSAVYINYRGFNALLTAKHVIKGDGLLKVVAPSGATSLAEVFAQSPENGRDLAILIPKDDTFLAGYIPLELSYKPPKIGMPLFSAGFQNEAFTFKAHKLLFDRFYINNGGQPGELNYDAGYYALSGATAPGNSGAPFISEEGFVLGLSSSILPTRDISLAIRYSVIKDFMRQSLLNKFADPAFDLTSFAAKYPILGAKYSNVINHFNTHRISAGVNSSQLQPVDNSYTYEGNIVDVSGNKGMSDKYKNFRFWFDTKVLGRSPKTVLKSLYTQGALPRMYIPLRYSGKTYELHSLQPYYVAKKAQELYQPFPFTNIKMYAHRGMSLNEAELLNIMENGLRKVDMPAQSLAILAPQVTPGTKLQAMSFSPYAMVSAQYATGSVSAEKPLPVMLDVTGINSNTALVNVHGMFTSRDIPPQRIIRYSVLLNIGGKEQWGEITRAASGGFIFKPYKLPNAVPANSNAAVFARDGNHLAVAAPGGFEETLKNSSAVADINEIQKVSASKTAVSEVVDVKNVDLGDGMKRSVWEAKNAKGETIGYLKYGNLEEFERTKQIDRVIKENNLLGKYDLLEIEYSTLLTEDISQLSPPLLEKALAEKKALFPASRNSKDNMFFILKKVDVLGFNFRTVKPEHIALLDNKPITDEEWLQIVDFYEDLHAGGFYHTDIWANLHIRRLENGKLKLTLLDFENIADNSVDMIDLQGFEEALVERGLKKDFAVMAYPNAFMPDSYSIFITPKRTAPPLE